MKTWEPRNVGGRFYYDPREELEYWIGRAGQHPMVAVPVELLEACFRRQECGTVAAFSSDEDGPIPPVEVRCRLNSDHKDFGMRYHTNGYFHWEDEK